MFYNAPFFRELFDKWLLGVKSLVFYDLPERPFLDLLADRTVFVAFVKSRWLETLPELLKVLVGLAFDSRL